MRLYKSVTQINKLFNDIQEYDFIMCSLIIKFMLPVYKYPTAKRFLVSALRATINS